MDLELTDLQKTILRLALANREAEGVTVELAAADRVTEIHTSKGVIRKVHQVQELKPSKEGWIDVEQAQVLKVHFGITYTPTFEEDFGILSAAGKTKESQEYRAAAQEVFDAVWDLDEKGLVSLYHTGPCSWSGLPTRVSAMLTEKGVKLTSGLGASVAPRNGPLPDLGPATPRSLDDNAPGKGPRRETPIAVLVGMLQHEEPRWRLAGAVGLRNVGSEAKEAILALEEAQEDQEVAVRLAAMGALEAIRGPSEEQLRSQALTRRLKSALLAEDYDGVAVLVMEGASTSLGEALREGIQPDAIGRTQQAAEQGNPAAQFLVGTLHFLGHGVPKDLAKAVRWWRRSAEQGNAQAQTNLGRMYYDGDGIEKDQVKAVKWFRRAAEQGDSSGQNNLAVAYMTGNGTDQSKAEAIKWFRRAAEQRNLSAQLALGRVYHTGEGVEQDKAEAVLWYGKAAERGNATAQRILGAASSDGDGVRQDKTEAAKWYRLAAEQGDAQARFLLGVMHSNGEGVEQDESQAIRWWRMAAKRGHPGGQAMLGLKVLRR